MMEMDTKKPKMDTFIGFIIQMDGNSIEKYNSLSRFLLSKIITI